MSGLSTPPSAATTAAVIATQKTLHARNTGSRRRPRRMRSIGSREKSSPPRASEANRTPIASRWGCSQVAAT